MEAKRGDLVLVEYRKDYGSKEPEFELERVTSVDRAGEVKATVRFSFGADHQPEPFYRMTSSRGHQVRRYRCYSSGKCWIVDQGLLDTDSVWRQCQERNAEHEWAPMVFPSVEAAKSWLQPFCALVAA